MNPTLGRSPYMQSLLSGGGINPTQSLQHSFAGQQQNQAVVPSGNFPAYNPDLPEDQRQTPGPAAGPTFNAPWQQSPTDAAGTPIPYPDQALNPPGSPGVITVQPQAPNAQGKTNYNTGAPIAPDTSVPITGGGISNQFMFTPTGGPVSGLGQALRVPTSYAGGAAPYNSHYNLPQGYADAIARGPAAAVDFLQSGPRGADGLTDAQRALVNQIKPLSAVPLNRQGRPTGINQFQETLDAFGASQTPTGTSTSANKITSPGGIPYQGGAQMATAKGGGTYPSKSDANGLTWARREALQRQGYTNEQIYKAYGIRPLGNTEGYTRTGEAPVPLGAPAGKAFTRGGAKPAAQTTTPPGA